MTPSKPAQLSCLECDQVLPDGQRWLCSVRCAAVMTLVRYGRKHLAGDADESGLEDARVRRYARQGGIGGLFPTDKGVLQVRARDGHRCQYPGCHARGADKVDFVAENPDLKESPRIEDLRTLCSSHHEQESRRRFVGPCGRVAHTAPATWARIEAAEPLVLRDNQIYWTAPAIRLLTAWPLAHEETRSDLARWIEVLGAARSEGHDVPVTDEADPTAPLNAALDKLGLPRRRSDRLVRAIHALFLTPIVDEASLASLREAMDRGGS